MNTDPLDQAMQLPNAHRYENYVAACCPFHDDHTASLVVHVDGFKCFACDAHGPLSKLWRKAKLSVSIASPAKSEKAEYLPHTFGRSALWIARTAYKFMQDRPTYQEYLINRGIGDGIKRFKLGYFEGWYTIPVFDLEGVKQIVFRASPFIQEKTDSRFFQIHGQEPMLYIPNRKQVMTCENLYITFGLIDAITLSLLGFAAASPTNGKNPHSFNIEWLDFHRGNIFIVPDLGEEKDARILASKLDWRGRTLLLPYPDTTKDSNDYLYKLNDPELLRKDVLQCTHSLLQSKTYKPARKHTPQTALI